MKTRLIIVILLAITLLVGCAIQPLANQPVANDQTPDLAANQVPTNSPTPTEETLPSPTPIHPTPTSAPPPTETPIPTEEPDTTPGIILFIGDGMGEGHRQAATWLVLGEGGFLAMDSLPVHGFAQTDNVDGITTGSAAAGTAFATGVKTHNLFVSLDPGYNELPTILEMAKAKGWATGLVTTVTMAGATPAVFASHSTDRYNKTDIARQMIISGVDVLLGGGEDDFFSTDENGCYYGSGRQPKGQGLIGSAIADGFTYICTRDEMLALNPTSQTKLLGLFAAEEIVYPFSPSLVEMTQTALSILSQDADGFFLMVEAGQIDWAAHEDLADEAMLYTIGLDTAVAMSRIFTLDRPNTLMIVAADHETGGMHVNKDGAGSYRQDGPFHMPDGTAFWVDWTSTHHTSANIPITAVGPYADMLTGEYHLTHIFETMRMMVSTP